MAETLISRLTDNDGNVLFDFCDANVGMTNFGFDGVPEIERVDGEPFRPSLQQTMTMLFKHAAFYRSAIYRNFARVGCEARVDQVPVTRIHLGKK